VTKRRKRRIAFPRRRAIPFPTTPADAADAKVSVTDLSWDFNKELICVGCARQLDPESLQGSSFL
jgi:hypothetical protein